MAYFADLEHDVLGVDTLSLALLTEVVVLLLSAMISSANDWIHLTTIANEAFVDLHLLLLFLFVDSFLEASVNKCLDLSSHTFDLIIEAIHAVHASLLAELAWFTFRIDLGTLALRALYVFIFALL